MTQAKKKGAGTKTATMHNWSPVITAKAKNKSKAKGRKAAAKRATPKPNGSKVKPKTRTITKYVARPGVTAKPNKGKKKGRKKNGSKGFGLMKFANPGIRNLSAFGKTAAIGVGGAVGAKILTAGEIGLLDRFAPELAQHKLMPYARPIATVANGYLVIAPLAGFLKASPQSRQAIKYASLFAGGLDLLDAVIGGNEVSNIGQKFRNLIAGNASTPAAVQTAQNTTIAAGAAQGAAAEALSAGLSTAEAQLVATRAFEGAQAGLGELRGVPSVNDYELMPGGSEWQGPFDQ